MAKKKYTEESLTRHRLYNKLYMREYRQICKDKVNAYKKLLRDRRWSKPRPKKLSIQERKRRQRIAVKKWRRLNPEKHKRIQSAHNHRRRAAIGRWTVKQLAEKFSYYGNKCFYCGGKEKLTIDHFIPLAKKPLNWLSNIRPACFPCNTKKGYK